MVLGISKYDAAETAGWLEEHDWTFPVLCDGGPAIESYGLLNADVSRETMQGIPHPATIIIDKQGKVRFVNVWVDFRQRTSPETIIEELKRIQ